MTSGASVRVKITTRPPVLARELPNREGHVTLISSAMTTRRRVLYFAAIRWQAADGSAQHGGWFVIEGRGCVHSFVAGPFPTRAAAEAAL